MAQSNNVHQKVADLAKARADREAGKVVQHKRRDPNPRSLFDGDEGDVEYAWEHFYTFSKNDHDHRERVQVNIHPDIAGMISEIVSGKLFPEYRTFADVMRDALYHRLKWLVLQAGSAEGQELVEIQMRRERIGRVQTRMDESEALIDDLDSTIQNAERLRDMPRLAEIVEQMKALLPALRSPYREQVKEKLRRCEGRLSI